MKKLFQLNSFTAIVKAACAKYKILDLSYGLIIDGKLAELESIGNANEHTLFRIGSNGKAITALMLLRALQEKNLTLDEKLIHVYPSIKFSNENYANAIKIKDILTHSSGHGKFTCSMMAYLGYSEDDLINSFEHIPFLKPPGASFQYQNGLYLLAGKLIEHLSAEKISDYFKLNLFDLIGMKDTRMGLSNTDIKKLALPYADLNCVNDIVVTQSAFSDAIGAGGNINTSSLDLSKWVAFNLSMESKHDEIIQKQFLPYVMFKQDLNPAFSLNKIIQWKGYGLGWYLNSFKDKKIIEHLGGVPGYTSFMSFSPSLNAGIAILCNKTDMRYCLEYLRLAFYSLLSDSIIPFTLNDLHNETLNYQTILKKQLVYNKSPLPKKLRNIALRFYNPQYSHVTFTSDENSAAICFNHTGYSFPVVHEQNGLFVAEDQQYNFNTSLKRVVFEIKDNILFMKIKMDNQQGGLTFIEEKMFHRV